MYGKLKRASIAGLTALGAVVLLAGFADPASAGTRSPAEITSSVFGSADPQAAYRHLAPTERAAFEYGLAHQTPEVLATSGGRYVPTAAERSAMTRVPAVDAQAVASALKVDVAATASGCWYRYYYKGWKDFAIEDGETWMQLNWCGSGGRITSYSQSNYGCAGHYGFTCSTGGSASLNVGWEIRSTRYFKANFFGYNNTLCMQVRGGATGLYSQKSSNSGGCPLG